MSKLNTIYVVRNVDGSRRMFKNLPVLMTQKEIENVSDRDHIHNNISTYCDPVWVDYNSVKNTMNPGSKIGNLVINAMGIDYKNMSCDKIYEVNVCLNRVLTK